MKLLQKTFLALGCLLAMGSMLAVSGAEARHHDAARCGTVAVCEARKTDCPQPRENCELPQKSCVTTSGNVQARVNCRPARGGLEAFEIDQEKLRHPSMLRMSGAITEIDGNKVVIRGEGQECVVALLNEDTYIVKGTKGKLGSAKDLKVGQEVVAYYSARMTRSLPPQAQAYALVIGDARKEYLPMFFVVDKVQSASDGSCVRVLNSSNDVIARIDQYACKDFTKIKEGDKLLLWSRVMTMSLPGQTNAEKVVVMK